MEECARDRREGFEVLLEEWGTSGRQRPTVQDLVALLQINKLYRAMDYLTVTVMQGTICQSSTVTKVGSILNLELSDVWFARTHIAFLASTSCDQLLVWFSDSLWHWFGNTVLYWSDGYLTATACISSLNGQSGFLRNSLHSTAWTTILRNIMLKIRYT